MKANRSFAIVTVECLVHLAKGPVIVQAINTIYKLVQMYTLNSYILGKYSFKNSSICVVLTWSAENHCYDNNDDYYEYQT